MNIIQELENHLKNYGTLTCVIILMTINSLMSQISGLSNNVYIPEYGTFDNISNKGDLSLQIASGALSNIDFPSARVAYGVYKNFTIGANFFSFGSSSPTINTHLSKGQIFSGDIGIYRIIDYSDKKSIKLHGSLSYGIGQFERIFTNILNAGVNLGIQRYAFSAGAVLKPNRKVNFNLGLTGKIYNYSDSGGFGGIPTNDITKFDRLIELSPSFLLDLNLRVEFGDDIAKLFFNWDYVLKNFNNEDDLLTDFLAQGAIHIGFNLLINRAINNIKIKRHEKN